MGIAGLRRIGMIALLAAMAPAGHAATEATDLAAPGVHADVAFAQYPPIASEPQVLSRFLSPLAAAAVQRRLTASGGALKTDFFDIGQEKFLVYVPKSEPPAGYGLLVFVPPWAHAQIPAGWTSILDRYGVIFVSADGSGNDDSVLERRVPLALAALADMKAAFRIDPTRTLVGGFSGGSRVAMRMALAYPDLFDGAFLNAGSDPIAKAPAQLPSPDLLRTFQTRTRVAYASGTQDPSAQSMDSDSRSSMLHWCVADIAQRDDQGTGHEAASPAALDWALRTLFKPPAPDTSRLAACREARQQEVAGDIAHLQRAMASSPKADVRRMLLDLDSRYGGLAAPQSVALADRCACGIFDDAP